MTPLEVFREPELYGPWFQGPSWRAWFAFLAALFGLPMSREQAKLYTECTGRTSPPSNPSREAWVIVGRRGGKTLISSALAVYFAAFRDFRPHLAPGEQAVVMLLGADRRQARVALRYVRGFLHEIPMLGAMVENETAERIELKNGSVIEVHTSSFRTVRGYSAAAVIADEVAFWPVDEDAANSDAETINALRPALANIPGSMLIGISSPYARRGVLWEQYKRYYAKDDGRVLIWRAPTAVMNPSLDPQVIAAAYEADEAAAAAEYGAEFRRDVEGFVSREAVEACVEPGRIELPPAEGVTYTAFTDQSGGSVDAATLAISFRREGRRVLACVRERKPPFNPQEVVADFAETLRRYGCRSVRGDRYAAEWSVSAFRSVGIEYLHSEKTRSDLYRELLPMLNAGEVELLDNRHLVAQLYGLERRTSRGGRDQIDHAPNSHDDLANAAAGALVAPGREPGDHGYTI